MSVRWRATCAQELVWAAWADGSAIYHRPSGKTHFVNLASALLLSRVLAEPIDEQDVARALLLEQDLTDQQLQSELQQRARHMRALLMRLEQIGLVERVAT